MASSTLRNCKIKRKETDLIKLNEIKRTKISIINIIIIFS